MTPKRALSGTAFATLLLIALTRGANHVAARKAAFICRKPLPAGADWRR
jgi:hypothetical protein